MNDAKSCGHNPMSPNPSRATTVEVPSYLSLSPIKLKKKLKVTITEAEEHLPEYLFSILQLSNFILCFLSYITTSVYSLPSSNFPA